jgi:hypothetical protein
MPTCREFIYIYIFCVFFVINSILPFFFSCIYISFPLWCVCVSCMFVWHILSNAILGHHCSWRVFFFIKISRIYIYIYTDKYSIYNNKWFAYNNKVILNMLLFRTWHWSKWSNGYGKGTNLNMCIMRNSVDSNSNIWWTFLFFFVFRILVEIQLVIDVVDWPLSVHQYSNKSQIYFFVLLINSKQEQFIPSEQNTC